MICLPDNIKSNHNASNDEIKGESHYFVANFTHSLYSLLSLLNDYDRFRYIQTSHHNHIETTSAF